MTTPSASVAVESQRTSRREEGRLNLFYHYRKAIVLKSEVGGRRTVPLPYRTDTRPKKKREKKK